MELIHILEGALHDDPFRFSLKIDHVMDLFLLLIQILHKTDDAVLLVEFHMLDLIPPAIFKDNRKLRVQIGRLVQTALDLLRLEPGLLEDLRIRQEINLCPRLLRPACDGQKAVLQLNRRHAALIVIVVDIAVPAHLNVQIGGKSVHHRGTHAVEAAAGLVYRIVKFAARVQGRKDQALRRDALRVQIHRDAPPVVRYGAGAVPLQEHADLRAEARQMLVHGIVHNLINQMVQPLAGHAPDVHAGPFAYSLQALQHGNTVRIVGRFLCHSFSLLIK